MAKKVSSSLEKITPKKAEEYLERNAQNRDMRRNKVKTMAQAMDRGEWVQNGEAIKFNGNDELRDGQHRLAAIIESGKALDLFVVRGLEGKAHETIDTGTRRSPADVLAIRGIQNPSLVSTCARAAHYQEVCGKIVPTAMNVSPTHQQLIGHVERDEQAMQEASEFALDWVARHPEVGLSSSLVAPLVYLFGRYNSMEKAVDFFEEVGDSKPGITNTLRERLIDYAVDGRTYHRNVRWAVTIKAFNFWMDGEEVKRLIWKRTGVGREPFPVVHGAPAMEEEVEDG